MGRTGSTRPNKAFMTRPVAEPEDVVCAAGTEGIETVSEGIGNQRIRCDKVQIQDFPCDEVSSTTE